MKVSAEDVRAAADRLRDIAVRTPLERNDRLSQLVGAEVWLKREDLQPVRSYKLRGAYNFIASLADSERANGVVCASAGNFGQAMAYACRSRDIALVVLASVNANRLKVDRMRSLRAEVRLVGQDFDAAKLAARAFAEQTGSRFVEDTRDLAT